jgi:hypothetical protein
MQTILSDVERRAIGNLSIPRNVADLTHALRTDPFAASPSEGEVAKLLQQLEGDGFVVNMGDGRAQSPGELAAAVDSHAEAVSMPDEKAQIFERRMSLPHRSWRLDGDVWMFTQEGFDKLHEPTAESPPITDPQVLEALLAAHGRAVIETKFSGSIFDKDGGNLESDVRLGSVSVDGERRARLLPEEFSHWAKQVIGEFEDRTGRKVTPPMQGGAGYSDAWENLGVDAENGKGTGFAVTAPWFMALTTVAVTDADTGSTITEPTGATGYARKSVAAADMNTAAAGAATNANAIIFAGITGGTQQTVIGFAKCIAATVGVVQKYGTTASTVISTTQTPAQFAASAFSTSLD